MNKYDRKNLLFLLNSSCGKLEEWSQEVSEDDLVYAEELLDAYQKELDTKLAKIARDEASSKEEDLKAEFEQAANDAWDRGGVYHMPDNYSVH